MKETSITQRVMLALATAMPTLRIFRNNTGMAWAGSAMRDSRGGVFIKDARPLHAGLCEGSSDLIGWTSIEITPAMVGRKVAVFTAVEVKQPGKRPTESQQNFLQRIREAGGIGFVATDPVKSPGDLKILAESLRE